MKSRKFISFLRQLGTTETSSLLESISKGYYALCENLEGTKEAGVFYMDLSKDKFIHFTTTSRAKEIIDSGKLLMDPPHGKFGPDAVFAASIIWGTAVPGVQTTHIKGDEPKVGIVFTTDTKPTYGYPEEVIWKQDVNLIDPKIIPVEEGLKLLKARGSVDDDFYVTYDEKSLNESLSTDDANKPIGVVDKYTAPIVTKGINPNEYFPATLDDKNLELVRLSQVGFRRNGLYPTPGRYSVGGNQMNSQVNGAIEAN